MRAGSYFCRLKKSWEPVHNRLRGGELSPQRIGLSVALGVLVGCSPFYGVHFFLCAGLSYLLRLDLITCYLAANISIPPLMPLLIFAELQLGSMLLSGELVHFSLDAFVYESPQTLETQLLHASQDLLVGAALLGVILGVVLGGAACLLAKFYQSKKVISH